MNQWISKGGILMFPLLFFSVISLAIIIYKLVQFKSAHISHRRIEKDILVMEEQGIYSEELQDEGLRHMIDRLGECENATVEDSAQRWAAMKSGEAEEYLHILQLIGNISPMIGLFGTVTGLAISFYDISSVSSTVDASLLANGIYQAMITTIAGLAVGIPSQIAYHLLIKRVDSWSISLQIALDYIVNSFKNNRRSS